MTTHHKELAVYGIIAWYEVIAGSSDEAVAEIAQRHPNAEYVLECDVTVEHIMMRRPK